MGSAVDEFRGPLDMELPRQSWRTIGTNVVEPVISTNWTYACCMRACVHAAVDHSHSESLRAAHEIENSGSERVTHVIIDRQTRLITVKKKKRGKQWMSSWICEGFCEGLSESVCDARVG